MTKIKATKKVAKDSFKNLKNGSIHKKKQKKFKNTPTGKVALVEDKNTQRKSNGHHQNGNHLQLKSPKQNKSLNGSNRFSNSPRKLNSKKSPKIEIKEEPDDDDSSIDDINEGISIKEEISAPEDEVDDDSSSSENEAIPDIFGQSLNETTDEDDDEFDADSDGNEKDAAENKGVKMFKGLQPKVEPNESSDDDEDEDDEDGDEEDDDDDDSSDEDAESAPGLKDLLGASIVDDSNDEDFKSGEGSDEDEDSDEQVDQSLNSSNATSTTDEDEDSEDDSSDGEAAPGLTALLGDSFVEESDDEDFEGDENDEDDEDDDMSEDDDDNGTPSPTKKIKVEKNEDSEEKDDADYCSHNESFDSTNYKSDAVKPEKSPRMSAKEIEDKNRRTIFIGNVPKETNLSSIKTMFKKFGAIESMRVRGIVPENPKLPLKAAAIKKNYHPKVKTFCVFVTFEDVESAEKALSMNGKKLDGNFLRVDHANKTRLRNKEHTVFLGNLPLTIEDNDVWDTFRVCGPIESVRIIRDRNTGVGRGFGYVNFESTDGATLAMAMNGAKIQDRELRIQVYTPPVNKKQRTAKRGHKRGLSDGPTNESPKKMKPDSETARRAEHNSVNAERRKDKKKRSQGEKQRGNSQNTSPEGKGAGKFQGQKADGKKKSKPNKQAKKKMRMAAKLLAKPKKPNAK